FPGYPRKVLRLLLFRAEKKKRPRNTDRLMRGDECRQIRVPAAQQHRRASIIELRQPETAILGRNFDSERPHRKQVIDVLLRDFTSTIDLVRVDMGPQIFAKLIQERLALGSVFFALCRVRKDPGKIVTTDKQVAGETATLIQWVARSFGQ